MARNIRSQVALEYTMLVGFILTVTLLILAVFGQRIIQVHDNNQELAAEKIKDMMFDQVTFALAAQEGYRSLFKMPLQIGQAEYNITIEGNITLVISLGGNEYVYGLPQGSIGNFCFDETDPSSAPFHLLVVRKINNTAEITSCKDCTVSYAFCSSLSPAECFALAPDIEAQCKKYCRCQ